MGFEFEKRKKEDFFPPLRSYSSFTGTILSLLLKVCIPLFRLTNTIRTDGGLMGL